MTNVPNEYAKQNERQDGLIETFVSKGARGLITAVTAFGKTWLGKKAIDKMHQRVPTRTAHVIVPLTPLKDQWEAFFREHNVTHTKVFVVNTYVLLMKRPDFVKPDLLVLDEVHYYASDTAEKHNVVFDVGAKFLLALTATTNKKITDFLRNRGIELVGMVTEEEADRENYIAKATKYNWAMPLPDHLQEEYDKYTRIIKSGLAVFDYDYPKSLRCMSKANVVEINETARRAKVTPDEVVKSANLVNWAVGARKTMLYEADEKVEAIKRLVEKFPVKTITFSQSTVFANKVSKALGGKAVSYHTKQCSLFRNGKRVVAQGVLVKKGKQKPYTIFRLADGSKLTLPQARTHFKGKAKLVGAATLNKEALQQFEHPDSGVDVINTAVKMDAGYDNKYVLAGYKTSGTSNPLQTIQRDGRIRRKDGKKQALIVNIYFMNTKDEDWLKSSLGDSEIQTVYSIDEIEYDYAFHLGLADD